MNKIETGFQKRLEPDLLVDLSTALNATVDYLVGNSDKPDLTEDEAFKLFINNPGLESWYKKLPETSEEGLRLKRVWEAFKEESDE